jgi:predicted kinase
MAKVFLVCGKICSGKSYYTSKLKENINAVVFSCDEFIKDIFPYKLGEQHDEIISRVELYLHKKTSEVVKTGTNVILEFGFWRSKELKKVSDLYTSMNIVFEWHYIDIYDEDWTNKYHRKKQTNH